MCGWRYVIRHPSDVLAVGKEDQAFKFVVINERESRFDYFYYLGIFNKTLPQDLSVPLKEMRGKLNSQPEYFLESYEMGQSNTQDAVKDNASGGHQVQVDYDGTSYTLTSVADPTDTRTVEADQVFESDGEVFHKVYDPVGDRFITISDAQSLAGAGGAAVYDGDQDAFRTITSETPTGAPILIPIPIPSKDPTIIPLKSLISPRLESQAFCLLDGNSSVHPSTTAGGDSTVIPIFETPSGRTLLHNRLTILYADGTSEVTNTYPVSSDDGKVAPMSAFDGLTTGIEFKNELLKWNYEQTIEATEFQGRKIDLVVEPKS